MQTNRSQFTYKNCSYERTLLDMCAVHVITLLQLMLKQPTKQSKVWCTELHSEHC